MKSRLIILLIFSILFANCTEEKVEKYPLSKRYWDVSDYKNITRILRFGIEPDEKLPTFDDPKSKIIVEKYTDPENYKVVLDDEKLGKNFRSKFASDLFSVFTDDMQKVYQLRDKTDKYIYEKEMLKVYQFGLGLQIRYFDLGNAVIIEKSDSYEKVSNLVNSNIQVLINNFKIYLELANDEKSFSEKGIKLYADGIKKYYEELIEKYPKANYNSTKNMMNNLSKKVKSEYLKDVLNDMVNFIEQKETK